ncbi:hypothetical protein LSH36_166g01039, partial [Paralvinella palmiformis]
NIALVYSFNHFIVSTYVYSLGLFQVALINTVNMAEHDDEQFEQASSGASLFYPKQCSALRKNEFVILKGNPCKIVDMSTSKTGKHGHAKVHLVGLDIFTGKKYEDICPSTHSMNVPIVTRTEYQVVDVSNDGYVSIMDDNGELREDLKLSQESNMTLENMQKLLNDENNYVTVSMTSDNNMMYRPS